MAYGYTKRREPECERCETALDLEFAKMKDESYKPLTVIDPGCGHIWDLTEYSEPKEAIA
jgi:hypothetical protein